MPSTLRSSLLDLDDVAPEDDFQMPVNGKGGAERSGEGDSSDEDAEEEDAADYRGHYEDVGPSSKRRKANLTEEGNGTLNSGKYKGQDARWSDMDGSDEEEEEEEEEDEEADSDDDDNDDEPRQTKSVRFQEAAAAAPSGPQTLFSSLSNQSQLVSTLRDQAKDDARKGKAIKEQMNFWQKALENRIKLEKVLGGRGVGRVQPSVMSDLVAGSSTDGVWALTSTLLDHSALLLETQAQLLLSGQEETLDMDDTLQTQLEDIIARPKRKRGGDDEDMDADSLKRQHLEQVSATLAFGSQILQPFSSSTLNSHSVRNSNKASSASTSDSNKFSTGGLKTFDQSIPKQIEIAMSGDSGERLIDRTKKYRGQGDRIGSKSRIDQEDDRETFDDSDFYSALLRSLIESSSTAATTADGDESNTPMTFHPRTNTKVRGVDTRASKGRKLRYEVIEKVANFMPRIANRENWTDEMRQRLYAILPGAAGEREAEDSDSEGEDTETDHHASGEDLGGLRLFG